jgi:hypothetical protein
MYEPTHTGLIPVFRLLVGLAVLALLVPTLAACGSGEVRRRHHIEKPSAGARSDGAEGDAST